MRDLNSLQSISIIYRTFLIPLPPSLPQNEVSCDDVEGDLKKVTFACTPVMSTYLLAFIVGEYDYVEETDANGVLVRVYTPVGKAEEGRFALNVSR